tara:strand:- start:260 stop:493 length:234 start_codon:yes stop_codon:yes gene_type:complete
MDIGDFVELSPARWDPGTLPAKFTWDPNNRRHQKVGIITGITTVENDGPMILMGYEVEWSDGEKSTETGFTIRKLAP